MSVESLSFPLDVEDDWPPVSVEALPFVRDSAGFRLQAAPLFVKGLSVNDVITVEIDEDGRVDRWHHVCKSNRSTIWLLRTGTGSNVSYLLEELRKLGCNTVTVDSLGCYSVDVPAELKLSEVDSILDARNEAALAVAFPSLRHPE